MDGASISSMDDYNRVLDAHQVGDTITVAVRRGNRQITLTMTPAAGRRLLWKHRRLTGHGKAGRKSAGDIH